MRLGAWPCVLSPWHPGLPSRSLRPGARSRAPPPPLRGQPRVPRKLEEAGLVIAGTSPDGKLVDWSVEIEDHPWFVACQFHPEFASTPFRPHPLFVAYVAAAKRQKAREN